MKTETEIIVHKYLNLGGDKNLQDFEKFFKEIIQAKFSVKQGTRDYELLDYVQTKVVHGLQLCLQYGSIYVMVDEDSIEDIEQAIEKNELLGKMPNKIKAPTKKKKGNDLGKLVDHGAEIPGGKSDSYWGRKGRLEIVFQPNDERVRTGEKIPSSYKYSDVRFLESYYDLKAFEFGNWLSQQDRINYLSGLGLGLFDLHKVLGFSPKQMGIKGKLSVTFGARGRGNTVAHFDSATFGINLTRYSRPTKLSERPKNFKRVDLIIKDGGGVGAYAHEFAHAMDYYCGTFIEKAPNWQISGGKNTNPAIRFPSLKKAKLQGLMDNLLNKIIWKGKNVQSDYYKRLNKKGTKEYYLRRNEIWARAFETYIQFKLAKYKHKNIFLNEPKYSERFYLTLTEMKKLEKDFDALIVEIKKHL